MRFLLFIFIFLFLGQFAIAQNDSLLQVKPERIIPGNISFFTTDPLGNIFIVNKENQVKKINDKGDSIAVFNNVKRYGKINYVDAGNPLKILVYFKDFATVVVLDRLLNVRNTIDLRKQNIFQVQALTSAYDGNIWLFDEQESKLKKINDFGNVILESTDYRLVFDEVPQPQVMFDIDGQLYLYDNRKGLLVLDYYGARKNNFQLLGLQNLQVIDKNTITGRDSNHIILYKPLTLELLRFNIKEDLRSFTQIRFTRSKLYALTKSGNLQVYLWP